MKTFLQHLKTGRFTPYEGSLYAHFPGLWMTMLQLTACLVFAVQGWLLVKGELHCCAQLFPEGVSDTWVDTLHLYSELALGYGLMGGVLVTLLVRIPYFLVLRWVLLFLSLASLCVVVSQISGADKGDLLELVGVISIPIMLFWMLSAPRALKQLGWFFCVLLFLALSLNGVGLVELAQSDEWVISMESAMGIVSLALGISLLIPFFRRTALYGILVMCGVNFYLLFRAMDGSNLLDPLLNLVTQGVLPLLILMLLQTWNPNNRLTLSMMEISSQTRRILSRAPILHK
ncbi:hypothetical protein [Rubritalea sp.]|uniref:hypothetical protein n=1 Tax=Rubritalea sp. TaxID=2109375 RepID=UPI003EF7AC7F